MFIVCHGMFIVCRGMFIVCHGMFIVYCGMFVCRGMFIVCRGMFIVCRGMFIIGCDDNFVSVEQLGEEGFPGQGDENLRGHVFAPVSTHTVFDLLSVHARISVHPFLISRIINCNLTCVEQLKSVAIWC